MKKRRAFMKIAWSVQRRVELAYSVQRGAYS